MSPTIKKIASALILMILLASCGYKEGIIESDTRSYLWFTGNTEDAVVTIDDRNTFELGKSYIVDEETGEKRDLKPTHYQVAVGRHRIVVKKNGKVLVDRVLILGNGATKEILIP